MLDPPTHNRLFADKGDKVGMEGVPKKRKMNFVFTTKQREPQKSIYPNFLDIVQSKICDNFCHLLNCA